MDAKRFFDRGWARFPFDPEIAAWARAARTPALETLADPGLRAQWLRCGGTWFAGVNALANGPDGGWATRGVPPLRGDVVRFIAEHLGMSSIRWDRAQISICFPGYPQPWEGESPAAFDYRLRRDAAHVDGLRRDTDRRRRPGETHGFILGVPLVSAPAKAAPLVVYEGSHEVMRAALSERLAGVDPQSWPEEDVTETYVAARRRCFAGCPRVAVSANPGEAYLVHRLCLHGIAPWAAGIGGDMRAIAYFRPDSFPGRDPGWWLSAA